MLKTDDYRRLLSVLDGAEKAGSLSAYRRTVLDGLATHAGYTHAAFLTGSTDEPKIEGVVIGYPQRRLDAWLNRFGHRHIVRDAVGNRRLDRTRPFDLDDIDALLAPAARALLDEYLTPHGIESALGAWLDGGGSTHGLVVLLGSRPFSVADRERLETLAPHLANLLAHHAPRHVRVAATPLLTPREAETVDLVAAGYSNRTIARRLNVTESTVKKHVSAALTKLGVTSRTQLTLAWLGGETRTKRGAGRGS